MLPLGLMGYVMELTHSVGSVTVVIKPCSTISLSLASIFS